MIEVLTFGENAVELERLERRDVARQLLLDLGGLDDRVDNGFSSWGNFRSTHGVVVECATLTTQGSVIIDLIFSRLRHFASATPAWDIALLQ